MSVFPYVGFPLCYWKASSGVTEVFLRLSDSRIADAVSFSALGRPRCVHPPSPSPGMSIVLKDFGDTGA